MRARYGHIAFNIARYLTTAFALGRWPWRPGCQPLPLAEMGAAYLPILEQHAASIWAVGVFCLHHPSTYAPDLHGRGRGVLELGEPYIGGVRWLTGYLHRW